MCVRVRALPSVEDEECPAAVSVSFGTWDWDTHTRARALSFFNFTFNFLAFASLSALALLACGARWCVRLAVPSSSLASALSNSAGRAHTKTKKPSLVIVVGLSVLLLPKLAMHTCDGQRATSPPQVRNLPWAMIKTGLLAGVALVEIRGIGCGRESLRRGGTRTRWLCG